MKKNPPSARVITLSLMRWEFIRTLFSLPNYAAVFLSLGVTWLMLNSTMNTVREVGLVIAANPFLLPFLATLLPYAIFLALAVAISLTREMESRTLEILFYAPIRFSSFVAGRFLGQMTYYFIAFPLVLIFFLGYSASMNLRITPGLLGAMALSPFTVASVVGFGLLVASYLRRTRATVIVLLITIFILMGIQFAHAVLPVLQPEEASTALIVLSDVVKVAYKVIEWISPFVYLAKGIEAAQISAPRPYITVLLASLAYTILILFLSSRFLERKGFSR